MGPQPPSDLRQRNQKEWVQLIYLSNTDKLLAFVHLQRQLYQSGNDDLKVITFLADVTYNYQRKRTKDAWNVLDRLEALLSEDITLIDFTEKELRFLIYSLRSVVARSEQKKEESMLWMERAWKIRGAVTDHLILSIFFYNVLNVLPKKGNNPRAERCFREGLHYSRTEKKPVFFVYRLRMLSSNDDINCTESHDVAQYLTKCKSDVHGHTLSKICAEVSEYELRQGHLTVALNLALEGLENAIHQKVKQWLRKIQSASLIQLQHC